MANHKYLTIIPNDDFDHILSTVSLSFLYKEEEMKGFIILTCIGLCLGLSLGAQDHKKIFQELTDENKQVIEALVLYPDSLRSTIFKACEHPEILVKLDLLQSKSQSNFQALIEGYSEKKQLGFYDLTRYPELVEQLVINGVLSKEEIRSIVQQYPQQIQKAALQVGKRHYKTLKKIHEEGVAAEEGYIEIMQPQDEEIRTLFKTLVGEPDILNILTNNIKLAILVGDFYRNDPAWLTNVADSLHLEGARKNAEELAEWKEELASDPLAMEEMREAAKDFAKDNAFELEEKPRTEADVYRSYPYWFGYPYWYSSPWWYPYPYWYHTGFYINSSGTIIIVGLPSYYYSIWFYNSPRFYTHLHRHYWAFYDRYPYSHSGLVGGLHAVQTYNPRVRTGPRTSEYIRDRSGERTGATTRSRATTPQRVPRERTKIALPRSPRSTVQRERANDYHRQKWDRSDTPRRSTTPRKPVTRKRNREN